MNRSQTLYQPQASDISIEADVYQFGLLRQKTPAERFAIGAHLIRWSRQISLRGIQKARGEQSAEFFARSILEEKWSPELMLTLRENQKMWIQDPSEIARILHSILEPAGISYYITGGVAALAYGDPRTTRDLDLVIAIDSANIQTLVTALEAAGFYCPPLAVEAVQAGRETMLSVTHSELLLNADLMMNGTTKFDQTKLSRRQLVSISLDENEMFWLISPEDLILAKLQWGQRSQSEKQWRDVLGVMKVQGENLDRSYLSQWATAIGLETRLNEALQASGL
jgi:CheY-like chemotaxis protein